MLRGYHRREVPMWVYLRFIQPAVVVSVGMWGLCIGQLMVLKLDELAVGTAGSYWYLLAACLLFVSALWALYGLGLFTYRNVRHLMIWAIRTLG